MKVKELHNNYALIEADEIVIELHDDGDGFEPTAETLVWYHRFLDEPYEIGMDEIEYTPEIFEYILDREVECIRPDHYVNYYGDMVHQLIIEVGVPMSELRKEC